jgi:hypothetical protein
MSKPQRTKKQHFVSQFYLRGFTNAEGNLFCYDKLADKSHPTTTLAAAQEAYFYDLPPDAFPPGVPPDPQMVEKALSAAEGYYAPVLDGLIQGADAGEFSRQQAFDFAPWVVMQWHRTKSYRETAFDLMQKSGQTIVDGFLDANGIGVKLRFVLDPKQMPLIHAQKIFDREAVLPMAESLLQHLWVIGRNDTGHPFYTSDHPVVRRGNRKEGGIPQVGANDPGVEFVFPLSSRHILLIMERGHFASWQPQDLRAVPLTGEQVNDYNRLQVLKSSQKLYCETDDFDLARAVCREQPEVRDPNRPRARVDRTPIKDLKNYIIATALE